MSRKKPAGPRGLAPPVPVADPAPVDRAELADDPAEARALIKRLHLCGGRRLETAELKALADQRAAPGDEQRMALFVAPPKPGPGRRSVKSQYELALERRKDTYRRVISLPNLRRGTGTTPKESIGAIFDELIATGERGDKIVTLIIDRLRQRHLPVPDRTTVLRTLKRLGKLSPN